MKLPIVWLKDYVDLKEISVDDLAERLSLAGFMLDKKLGDGEDFVLDFELRGNRAEMYSVLGMAQETAVLFNLTFNSPLLETKITENLPQENLITVDAKDLVNRFQAIYLKNIKIGSTPEFIRKRLELMGMPSINNVVDITNYVMLETGQPLHAFDRGKLVERRLIVRRAKENERFTTLDGVFLQLNKEDLVIADAEKAMAFAGIVGGRDCAIDENTREIILEAANYDRVNVRKSSFLRNVRTEASTRLEKFLDPNLVDLANQRCVELLKKYAGAEIVSWQDYYPQPITPKIVKFDYKEVRRLTGIEIKPDEGRDILIKLGFKVEKTRETEWRVVVPTIRRDINEEADLVEEIVRIYGYDRLPSQLIEEAPPERLASVEKDIEKEIKRVLLACGFNEAITLPLINDKKMMAWEYAKEELIYLANPPGFDYNCLVASLLPGLWEFWQISQQYQVGQNMFFEIGKTFSRKQGKHLEEEKLAVLIGGENYGYLKGVLETILEELGIDDKARENLTRGIFQKEGVTCWEISIVELSKLPRQLRKYGLLPSYSLIKEDLTFVFKDKAKWSDIKEKIQQISTLIAAVEWKGDYREDNGVARTITVIYQNCDKNLSDAEIAPVRKQIVNAVEKEFGAKLKGKLS